ncbi:hypothetical protein SAMN05444280_11594 [Tangfeifania diversioriginum]|uniref:Uncharacterized protein n=1 Tax=Tangfeifania diversioriginum TaxID=1168035 RepID=A0A1M6I533_9BACT|nr:hypothetical protein [Tangfeifania diversioriginum]SHJ29577.1 hypothetical protein SAMN05444280_11594 [Tangfeifania diversioriginum]
MKPVRNMRELGMLKKQLKYQEELYEKQIVGSTADIVENSTDKLRDIAMDMGTRIIVDLITGRRHHKRRHKKEKHTQEE